MFHGKKYILLDLRGSALKSNIHPLGSGIVLQLFMVLPYIWVFHQLHIALHGLLFAHTLNRGPCIPFCSLFELRSPWLASLDITFCGLSEQVAC